MASSMRAKRAWEEPEPSEEAVAFEKAVAALAESIAKPHQVPGSTPEDPTDHKRWLEQQFAAIQAGRTQPEPRFTEPADHSEPIAGQEEAQFTTQTDTTTMGRLGEAAHEAKRHVLIGLSRTNYLCRAGYAWCTAKARVVTQTSREILATHFPAMTSRSAALLKECKQTLARASSWSKEKAETLAPPLYAQITSIGNQTWSRVKDTNSRQRLIAGALLLSVGGLLIVGSLILRAIPVADPDPAGPIAWGFEAADEPFDHRMVFTLAGTPQAVRINGLLIRAVNISDQPLTSVEGVIRPDTQHPDLKLILDVDPSTQHDPKEVDIDITSSIKADTIPPQAPFHLIYAFPGDGLSVEEFIDTYGGLTLNVRYEVDGKQRTVIQYLSPEMLRDQLYDIGAAGS
ncbi:MAG: hypothetical protein FJX44_09640 [Alphaproteobacteria bacterium]|nr:hypothetical protein [Alphaproteobacteria bacterium]